MTPARQLAHEIVLGFQTSMNQMGIGWSYEQMVGMFENIAEEIQKVADDQSQQSGEQAFGDVPIKAILDLDSQPPFAGPCSCCPPPLGITVTFGPMLPPSGGRN